MPPRFVLAAFAALAVLAAGALADAAEPDLKTLVEASRSGGPEGPALARMTLVDATSNHLRRIDGDLDFPFQVGVDLPVEVEAKPLGRALKGAMAETGRYVVIFDVALARVTRRVRDMKDVASRRVVSVNKFENPAFLKTVTGFQKASANLERRPDNPKLAKRLEEASAKLENTPQYLEQKVWGDYHYKLADVEGSKSLSVNYYLVDRQAGRYLKSTFDVIERERFTLAYDLERSDPQASTMSNDVAREEHVKYWERAPVMVELQKLLEHALAQGGPTQPMGELTGLLDQVARDRSRAAARAEAERYEDRPLNDPRFDSVVVIYSPSGMGSGFYVRSNIVMTNWHVVQDRPIVELRLYDKRETFGQVIAKDVLLDLALVKVQTRGRPVEFYSGKELLPGEQLDAIGHPKNQTFTITRGVVSSIRRMKVKSNPVQGRAEVLYIQTDADINPGNSGGPLFRGGKVVGVNTFSKTLGAAVSADPNSTGPVAVTAPGLNFSVHFSEAKRFLDESLKGGE